ncbi:MAG: SIMPL domain-containing protein [Clostridia bacterium]|nr:SIMPL domain-containing protein [Clostridia bacterium]
MDRIITVRGAGKLSLSPDKTSVDFRLTSKSKDYFTAVKASEAQLSALAEALAPAGFEKDDVKTVHFGVSAEYESVRDNGVYRNVFSGYAVSHSLRLEFPFDNDRLSAVLTAASRSLADPDMSVSFSVSDAASAEEELLKRAAKSARKRAETLAAASGVSLGELISVDYDSGGLSFESPTRLENRPLMLKSSMDTVDMSFSPEDVSLEKSAVFVWELK